MCLKNKNVKQYHPASFEVEADKLSKVLQFFEVDETQPYGQELTLGKFLGKPLVLSVQ